MAGQAGLIDSVAKDRDDHRSDLFIHDTSTLRSDILLPAGATSYLKYQEYAVFNQANASSVQPTEKDKNKDRPFFKQIAHFVSSEDGNGDELFHQAVRDNHTVDTNGNWGPKLTTSEGLQGRVRQVVCRRRSNPKSSEDLNVDGLHLADQDYTALDIHPATLQYVRRRAVESLFWDRHHEKLSIILSFPTHPQAPYDFLSINYTVATRTTTTLIRQSFDPYQHEIEDLDQYDIRMQACKSHWAHPLLIPVILLQVQFARTERAVADNQNEVIAVERDVSNMAGFDAFKSRTPKRGGQKASENAAFPGIGGMYVKTGGATVRSRTGSLSQEQATTDRPVHLHKNSTELMKNAHDVLRKSIRLLDTLNWIERAIQVLIDAGDQVEDVRAETVDDPLVGNWHEIRQYLESLLQLCLSLKTDRTILEMRCNALVDIIYSKMAQEDNNLNAKIAVSASRDSSSMMKALAVITAIFLPGEFMSSLFGMGIFDWQTNNYSSSSSKDSDAVVSYDFWWYWALTVPLTIVILALWRAWWVGQDRYFRRHLSKALCEEPYWTDDHKPRQLETNFFYDFLHISMKKGETSAEDVPAIFRASTSGSNSGERLKGSRWFGKSRPKQNSVLTSPTSTSRQREIASDDMKPSRRGMGIV